METTLHRELKSVYAPDGAGQEVALGGYRIDAVAGGRLIEIQYGSLGAIRRKVRALLADHRVHVVKPLAARKYLITRNRKRGRIVSARYSPLRESHFHLFADLVHFLGVFPHPNLTLEAVLTEQEEHRLPSRHSRRRSYRVEDRRLRGIVGRLCLQTADDLTALLPDTLPHPFSTADLAAAAGIPRWLAQKMAYCLRQTGAATPVGKQGNALLYDTAIPK